MDASEDPHRHEPEADEEEGLGVSRWAFARLLDDLRARKDRQVRRLVRAGQPFVSDVRALDDARVVGLLGRLGLEVDRERFADLVKDALSAEEVADRLAAQEAVVVDGYDDDRLLFGLGVLWERWLPEQPSNEMLDDWVVAGYAPMRAGRPLDACAAWLPAWGVLQQRARLLGLRTLEGLEQATRLTMPILEWIQDLPEQLLAAGKKDAAYHRRCVELIGECFAGFETPHRPQVFEHLRVLLAEGHAELGEGQRTDELYREWLAADPQWGWGYVCWSDCYRHVAAVKDLSRAEAVLRQALKVEGLREEIEVLDRLVGVLDALERFDEADEVARRVDEMKKAGAGASQERTGERGRVQPPEEEPEEEATVVREGPKVGRNDPCPCGSGKKYKKCCGK